MLQKKLRGEIDVIYNTALPVIFGVKKYADALWKVCDSRNIKVNVQTCLLEIKDDCNEAVFENLANPSQTFTQKASTFFFLFVYKKEKIINKLKNYLVD